MRIYGVIAIVVLSLLLSTVDSIKPVSPTVPAVQIIEPKELAHILIPLNLASFSLIPPDIIGLEANLSISDPIEACSPLISPKDVEDTIVLVHRGGCLFQDKVRFLAQANAVGYLISNVVDSTFPMPVWGDPSSTPQCMFNTPSLPLVV